MLPLCFDLDSRGRVIVGLQAVRDLMDTPVYHLPHNIIIHKVRGCYRLYSFILLPYISVVKVIVVSQEANIILINSSLALNNVLASRVTEGLRPHTRHGHNLSYDCSLNQSRNVHHYGRTRSKWGSPQLVINCKQIQKSFFCPAGVNLTERRKNINKMTWETLYHFYLILGHNEQNLKQNTCKWIKGEEMAKINYSLPE